MLSIMASSVLVIEFKHGRMLRGGPRGFGEINEMKALLSAPLRTFVSVRATSGTVA